MEPLVNETIAHVQGHTVSVAALVLLAGFTACKTVASDWRSLPLFLIVGLLGFALGQFAMLSFMGEYLRKVPEFRVLFDFLAAYLGAFAIATIIHFIKPV